MFCGTISMDEDSSLTWLLLGQITRRIKRTLTKTSVDPTVAARKAWPKFGNDKGKPPGPDRATTTVGENVHLKLLAGGQKVRLRVVWIRVHADRRCALVDGNKVEPEPDQETDVKKQLEGKKIQCRLCKGGHFTTKCPYKDSLGSLGLGGGAFTILFLSASAHTD